jgi:hypothetical protein
MSAASLLAALAGCGGGGASPDAGGGHGGSGGGARGGSGGGGGSGPDGGMMACSPGVGAGGVTVGTVSWADDGVAQCAYVIETTRTTTTIDFLDIIAVGSDTRYSVNLTVSTDGTPIAGAYSCGSTDAAPDVMLGILDPAGTFNADSCTIAVTSAGSATAHAQGTFSATAAGAHAITNGVFDVTVTSM